MFKFTFIKKNKTPSPNDLNPGFYSPNLVWITIILLASVLVILAIILSAILFWQMTNKDLSLSPKANDSAIPSIDTNKLKEVVEIIDNRTN